MGMLSRIFTRSNENEERLQVQQGLLVPAQSCTGGAEGVPESGPLAPQADEEQGLKGLHERRSRRIVPRGGAAGRCSLQGADEQSVRGRDVALAVEQDVGGGDRRAQRSAPVRIGPAAIRLTRILCGPSSRAR